MPYYYLCIVLTILSAKALAIGSMLKTCFLTLFRSDDEYFKQRHLDWAAVHDGDLELYFRAIHNLNRAICRRCYLQQYGNAYQLNTLRETLIKPFDKLRTNGKWLIPFVVSLSNHERNQLVQRFLNYLQLCVLYLQAEPPHNSA